EHRIIALRTRCPPGPEPLGRRALAGEDTLAPTLPAIRIDLRAMMAACIDAEGRNPQHTIAARRECPCPQRVKFLPCLRLCGVAVDDLIEEGPTFLICSPGDQLDLEPVALHVTEPGD